MTLIPYFTLRKTCMGLHKQKLRFTVKNDGFYSVYIDLAHRPIQNAGRENILHLCCYATRFLSLTKVSFGINLMYSPPPPLVRQVGGKVGNLQSLRDPAHCKTPCSPLMPSVLHF